MSLSADGTLSSIYCLFRSCLFFWLCWALSLSVWLFATPWSAAHQAPLSVHGDSPGKNTGVGCHTLLQGIFPIQGLNPGLPHCRQILYQLSYQRSPKIAGVGSLSLLQQIFLTQELNWGLLHCRRILYQLTSLCFSESISCEKEISPAILINKTCHSHQWFLASKYEWGLPKLWSSRCCHTPGWLLRSWGNARSRVNKETNRIGPRYLRYIWKEWMQWAQRLASSHTLNAKVLNLIPDIWCSDCLLPLLKICI